MWEDYDDVEEDEDDEDENGGAPSLCEIYCVADDDDAFEQAYDDVLKASERFDG